VDNDKLISGDSFGLLKILNNSHKAASKKTATECLKAQPEDDNKLIAPWRSLI